MGNNSIQMETLPVFQTEKLLKQDDDGNDNKIIQSLGVTAGNSPDLNNLVLPYIIPGKILMSPGVWNDYYYGSDSIQDAYLKTAWDDKDVRALFLDHEDLKSSEWVGEIINPRMEGDTLIGDLSIVDKATAIKLAYGAKMGISPKVSGQEEEYTMMNFVYNNFSVVICPAVKTAYINNSAKSPYGDISYADPGYQKDKKKRYPIDTDKHIRAAWSYISMPKNRKSYTADQLKTIETRIKSAAKKIGIIIKNNEVQKMAEEEITPAAEETKPEVPKEEVKPEAKEEETPKVETPAPAAETPAPEPESGKVDGEVAKEMAEMKSEIKTMFTEMLSAIKGLTASLSAKPAESVAPAPAEPVMETKINEMSAKIEAKDQAIQELAQKIEQLENVPDKATVKAAELSQRASADPDAAFLEMLKGEVPQ